MKTYFKYFTIAIFVFSGWLTHLSAENPVLPELLNPSAISVGKENLYIVDNNSIYIYSRGNYKLIKKFGRKGEGPGEFPVSRRGNTSLKVMETEKGLFVHSRNKVIWFDIKGRFLKELKAKTGFIRGLLPVGKYYTGRSFSFGANRRSFTSSLFLFDEFLNKKKELLKFNTSSGRGSFFKIYYPDNVFLLKTWKDRVLVVKGKDFRILIFNSRGIKTGEIKLNYSLLKVSSGKKSQIENYYKTESNFSNFWSRIKNYFSIDQHYPAIRDLFVDDSGIFVETYYEKGGKVEFFIFSKEGKFIKKSYPVIVKKNIMEDYPLDIKNNRIYQLIEDEDEEEWYLKFSEIR